MKSVTVCLNHSRGVIAPEIYGHFCEHLGGVFYDGLWVGPDSPIENIHGFRKALVDSFRKICPPVLRWPGGCFAETYDWRDGIGPREKRPRRLNWWYNNDGRVESNQVGTHEFIDLCRLVGAQPYFAANMTSVTPLHIRDWMEYCNMPAHETTLADERAQNGDEQPFGVRYWGIGNENWGGGGNMTAEMCAREFMRCATVCRSVPGQKALVACGANGHDVAWTREMMRTMHAKGCLPEALSVHYYCGTAGTPQEFTEAEWYELLRKADFMRRIVDDHRAAMDEFDPERRVSLFVDEWGCWHQEGTGPSKGKNLFEQQSNLRDAVVAALTLNLFNNRCDVVGMSNVAQLCNNLHTLYLASGEHFLETPTYFVYDLFKAHQSARQLETLVDCGCAGPDDGEAPLCQVSASASQAQDGSVTLTLANLSVTDSADVRLDALGGALTGTAEISTLCAADPHTCNTFENPHAVRPVRESRPFASGDTIRLPAASVVSVRIAR
ncbi:MAG: alpha-L-arabinofuranosidase C-terminal domain-containing protein [Eubacteriales bacterium]|nr:alpha-L-arabinofuranosidase C-terminal domain-containing protein [Eubacteriales bacterium]